MSAPSASACAARSTAASTLASAPPSENESGVKFMMAIRRGRSSVSVRPCARRQATGAITADDARSGRGGEPGGVPGGVPGGTPLCPPCVLDDRVARVVLTASGGALRDRPRERVYHATPADALAHPTWSMGAKVTIDSASLTNKALEVIEAHWLFGLESARIGVLVHPQSIVHSFVEFADRSVIAQLGAPDMRTPIQYALSFPQRPPGCSRGLDWAALRRLDFDQPDLERFPALGLGFRVVDEGGTSGAVLNGANESAVEAFLAKRIPFGRIAELAAGAMDELGVSALRDLGDVFEADREARRFVGSRLSGATVG
ncbi:MAG TPA: hypothetical protein DEB06_00580 [Phycisphaerales bacterium]|nr:hypothetical protein [Phycisphaerales bacterium]